MKTPEDEAFEEIERKQGGGFPAKRAMAADKLQEPEREALKLALEAIERYQIKRQDFDTFADVIAAGREALAQPAQEPVAWMCCAFDGEPCEQTNHDECGNPIPLYTTPPKREWVELTDEDIERIKLMTYEKETNADGEEQEAVNIDWLIKTAEHFCKEKNT